MAETVMLEQIAGALAVRADQTAAELVDVLRRLGVETTKGEINGALYAARDRFWTDGVTPPRWRLVAQADAHPAATAHTDVTARSRVSLGLYEWQREALAAWRAREHRGVIEAVTGTGKTRVGLAAASESLGDGGKVQVIVPTVELLRQWQGEVRRHLPGARIGQLGAGRHDSWSACDVLISTVHSASFYDPGLAPRASLLVADECHRYGSESFAEALDARFARRLGLSATYLRLDSGNAVFLDPYFGDTCFRMDYRRAIADDVTAHFKVALIGVRFSPAERIAYDQANREAWEAQKWLIESGLVREEPFGDFMKDVVKVSTGDHGRATWKARSFLKHFAERRRVLAETSTKREKLAQLAPALSAADRSIVFTQTIEAAEEAVDVVSRNGSSAAAIHSGLDADERRSTLGRFADGRLSVIAAPQVLDEGIDVPAADLAIILAASKTRRQMIQRMGRVLRKKEDGRLARFVVLYVESSSEDPATGAHAVFLEEILGVADDVQTFRHDRPAQEICSYLNHWEPAGGGEASAPVVKEPPAARERVSPAAAPTASANEVPQRTMTSKRAKRLLKASGKSGLSQASRFRLNTVLFKLGELSDDLLINALRKSTNEVEFEANARRTSAGAESTLQHQNALSGSGIGRSKDAAKHGMISHERLGGLLEAYRDIHGDRLALRYLPDLKTLFRNLADCSDRVLVASMRAASDPREIEHRAKVTSARDRAPASATAGEASASRIERTRERAAPSSGSHVSSRHTASGAAAGERPLYGGAGPDAQYCGSCGRIIVNCRC